LVFEKKLNERKIKMSKKNTKSNKIQKATEFGGLIIVILTIIEGLMRISNSAKNKSDDNE